MMKLEIEYENTFRAALKDGINVFTGAGFSVLPDEHGRRLPTGKEYATELIQRYELKGIKNDLDRVANIAPDEDVQRYTRERFKVDSINEKYLLLKKINIASFITTNYDNIPQLIFNKECRLYDAREGLSNSSIMIPYVPIHGDVLREDYRIIIGSMNVVSQNDYSSDALRTAAELVSMNPTLVWGYGMQDSSSEQVFLDVIKNKSRNVWLLCHPDMDETDVSYYRLMGFKIIRGDTESMLDWISSSLPDRPDPVEMAGEYLRGFLVPEKLEDVPRAEAEDYFKYGNTQWYHILSHMPCQRPVVERIVEAAHTSDVVLVTGQRFSGRTTVLMQTACKIDSNRRFFFRRIDTVSSDMLLSAIGDEPAWVFIDDCPSLDIIRKFSPAGNIHLIAAVHDLLYESEKFRIEDIPHDTVDVTELGSKVEALEIFGSIPAAFRKDGFEYKLTEDEKYSMIELVSQNVDSPLSKNMVQKILQNVLSRDRESLEMVALTVYLSDRGSALTTDVIMAYFGLDSLSRVEAAVDKVNSLLRDVSENCRITGGSDEDQDYYWIRSGLFMNRASDIFETKRGPKELRDAYATMVSRFIRRVIPLRIWRYEAFKKREYDADLFFNLFSRSEADELYSELYEYNENPYVLQQWALFHRRCKDYRRAFDEITKVDMALPRNPSVKNSYAMILFEMSYNERAPGSLERMEKAMGILESLHKKDSRKVYHTSMYAKYAVILSEGYDVHPYLIEAYKWILDLEGQGRSGFKAQKEKLTSLMDRNGISHRCTRRYPSRSDAHHPAGTRRNPGIQNLQGEIPPSCA